LPIYDFIFFINLEILLTNESLRWILTDFVNLSIFRIVLELFLKVDSNRDIYFHFLFSFIVTLFFYSRLIFWNEFFTDIVNSSIFRIVLELFLKVGSNRDIFFFFFLKEQKMNCEIYSCCKFVKFPSSVGIVPWNELE